MAETKGWHMTGISNNGIIGIYGWKWAVRSPSTEMRALKCGTANGNNSHWRPEMERGSQTSEGCICHIETFQYLINGISIYSQKQQQQ